MPSAFTHAIASVAIGSFYRDPAPARMIVAGMACSVIPDLDAIGFHTGVDYSSVFGHRGITHSILFSFILAVIVMLVVYRSVRPGESRYFRLLTYFFLATLSHPLLDAMTNGGLGVALFAPFNNERIFFSFRPIRVAPISVSGFFTARGWEVFKSELVWVWVPSLILIVISFVGFGVGKRRGRG